MTKIKIKMNHVIQYINTPPHLLARGEVMTLYYVNHVIHPIDTPDSIYGVGVYHAFLVVWPIWSEILW